MAELEESLEPVNEPNKISKEKTKPDVKFNDGFDAVNRFFNCCGMWDIYKPKFTRSRGYYRLQRIYYICSVANLFPLMVGEFTYLVMSFRTDEDRFLETVDMLPCFILSVFAYLKTGILITKRDKVRSLVVDLEKIWPDSDEKEVKKIVRDNMSVAKKFCVIYMTMTNAISTTYPCLPLAGIAYNCIMRYIFHRDYKWNDRASMPYIIWYPFDWTPLKVYIPTYISQIFAGFWVSSCVCSTDCFFCILVSQVCMHYQLLQRNIENITKNTSISEQEKLKNIVEYHNQLYSFSERIEEIFSATLYVNFASSSLMICIELFSISIAPMPLALKYALFLGSSVGQIFLMCIYGDKLIEESGKVSESAYNSDWTTGSRSLRHGVLMLMTRARKPATVSLLGFTTASFTTFSSIMSASWSYFTMLHHMYEGAVE
uniref:Odorant receptor n=1 Tax=Rhyacophila nubila TaxID=1876001 RepID=A0A3G2KX57_9NEOP|nr:odorant receptor OR11 [Rhyacophila nubila]